MNRVRQDDTVHNAAVYNRNVREYIKRFMDLGLYKDTFDPLMNFLPSNATVLDLGCGPGNVVKYLKAKRPDLQILGIDLAPEMIREAELQNPEASFQHMDIRDIGALQQQYNAIIAAFCIPYMAYEDVPELVSNVQKRAAEKCVLYLSCMEGPRTRSGFEKTSFTVEDTIHINYYGRDEIQSWLEQYEFTIEAFDTRDYKEPDGSITTDLIYIASTR